jgi:hypothetical protein
VELGGVTWWESSRVSRHIRTDNRSERAGEHPSKFRDVLRELGDDRIFITNFRILESRCLEARPYSEWLKLEARIAERTI